MLTDRFNKTNIMFANELSNDLLNDSQIIKSIADSDNTKLSQQIESALKIQKIIKNRIEMLLQSDIKVDDQNNQSIEKNLMQNKNQIIKTIG